MKVRLSLLTLLSLFVFLSSCSKKGSSSSSDSGSISIQNGTNPLPVKDLKATYKIMSNGKWAATLTWTTLPTIKSYTIKRGIKTAVYDDTYPNVTSPYTISNLEPGTTQFFRIIVVATVGGADVSVTSDEYSIKLPIDAYTEKPGAFTMYSVGGPSQATITWADSARASFYTIHKGTTKGSYPTVVKELAKSPYVDTKATNGQKTYYMVIAINSAGSTNATDDPAHDDFALPAAALGDFTLTAIPGNSKVTLNWGSSTGALQYRVFRSTSPSSGFVKISGDLSSKTYTDNTAVNGTLYYYQVSAVGGSFPAKTSNTVSATPMPLPSSFTATAQAGDSQVTLTWPAVTNATTYTIQYGTSSGSYPMTVSSSATSPFIVTGLSNGTPYYFIVTAVNGTGSTDSGEITATPVLAASWVGIKQFGAGLFVPAYSYNYGLTRDSASNVYTTSIYEHYSWFARW